MGDYDQGPREGTSVYLSWWARSVTPPTERLAADVCIVAKASYACSGPVTNHLLCSCSTGSRQGEERSAVDLHWLVVVRARRVLLPTRPGHLRVFKPKVVIPIAVVVVLPEA